MFNLEDQRQLQRMLETGARVALLLLLLSWCYITVRPFISTLLWGAIIAAACQPLHQWLVSRMGGRHALAAWGMTMLALMVLIVPTVLLSLRAVASMTMLAGRLREGQWSLPPANPDVRDWPLVGEMVYDFWLDATNNLQQTLVTLKPQLEMLAGWLIQSFAGAGMMLLQMAFAVVVAGALLSRTVQLRALEQQLMTRLAGHRGGMYTQIALSTVRSVAVGVLGVGVVQGLVIGIILMLYGVPVAGLLALTAMVLSVVQIGVLPVTIPVLGYMLSVQEPVTATSFAVLIILASLIDNILKPLVFGRGSSIPMLVIFIGAIGGLMSAGLIGLFVGAVALALAYTLLMAWLDFDENPAPSDK